MARPMTTFVPRQGSHLTKDAACLLGAEFTRLAKARKGRLQAQDVVEEASDASSPLHPFFEWDNDEAATQWRLHQARTYLAQVYVRVERADGTTIHVVAFPHIRHREPRPAYVTLRDAMSHEDTRQELLGRALQKLENLEGQYGHLKELAEVFAAAREVARKKRRRRRSKSA